MLILPISHEKRHYYNLTAVPVCLAFIDCISTLSFDFLLMLFRIKFQNFQPQTTFNNLLLDIGLLYIGFGLSRWPNRVGIGFVLNYFSLCNPVLLQCLLFTVSPPLMIPSG